MKFNRIYSEILKFYAYLVKSDNPCLQASTVAEKTKIPLTL